MTKIAIILGADEATAADDMQEVLDFETLLANASSVWKWLFSERKSLKFFIEVYVKIHFQASLSEIERHDTSSVYHKLTLEALKELVPEIKWDVYLQVKIFTLSKHLFRCLSSGL